MQLAGKITVHKKDVKAINAELKELKFTSQFKFTRIKDDLDKNIKSVVDNEEEGENMYKEDKSKEKEKDND